jgi:type IV pilus assembly protein PilE
MQQTNLQKGFSLLELLIAILVLGIIVSISAYTYSTYALKGQRIDATNSLLSISLAEENYRNNNTTYGTDAQVWGGVTTSAEGFYTLAITNVSATSYTITATAIGNQANDAENGTSCSSIVLAVSNGTVTKTPAACWPT